MAWNAPHGPEVAGAWAHDNGTAGLDVVGVVGLATDRVGITGDRHAVLGGDAVAVEQADRPLEATGRVGREVGGTRGFDSGGLVPEGVVGVDQGVVVEVVDDPVCVDLMTTFIAEHPDLWNEDIGE